MTEILRCRVCGIGMLNQSAGMIIVAGQPEYFCDACVPNAPLFFNPEDL